MRPTEALFHPPDWGTTTVAQSVQVKRGVSWSKDQERIEPRDDRVPVIGIANVQERLKVQDILYLSGLKPAAVAAKRVAAGWTIMVGSNGNPARVGNAVLVRDDTEFLFASFLIGAKPQDDSGLSPEYFYRWLSSERVQGCLSASSEGTTSLKNLSQSFFRAMTIPIPPPDEQAAIARILDAVDTVLERTRAAVERARVLRESLIHDFLSRGTARKEQRRSAAGFIPRSWTCEPLGKHLAEGPTNGVYRPESDYAAHGTRIVRIDDFDNGRIKSIEGLRAGRRRARRPDPILLDARRRADQPRERIVSHRQGDARTRASGADHIRVQHDAGAMRTAIAAGLLEPGAVLGHCQATLASSSETSCESGECEPARCPRTASAAPRDCGRTERDCSHRVFGTEADGSPERRHQRPAATQEVSHGRPPYGTGPRA